MAKLKVLLILGTIVLLLFTGCQALVPTAQILSRGGLTVPSNMEAMPTEEMAGMTEAATPEATEEVMVEATPEATEEMMAEATTTLTETAEATEEVMVEATPEATEEMMAEATTLTETAEATEEVMVEATPEATEEMMAEATTTLTETAEATEEVMVEATATLTETATTEAMTEATAEPTELTAVDTATVLVRSLRIRSGPGTTFEVVGGAVQGERFPITGQAFDCQWYQIDHPQLGQVWLAGGDFASSDGACADIPESDGSAAPANDTSAPTPITLQPTATPAPVAAPTAAPTAEATSATSADSTATTATDATDPFPADKGCLLLQNQLGPELTFTFTSDDGSFTETVKVNADADVPYCLAPGRYRVTVDAPPPWADINEEFSVAAGDRFFFPIRPQ